MASPTISPQQQQQQQTFLKESHFTPASSFHLKGDTPTRLTKELEWVCVDETCSLDSITAAFLYTCAMSTIYPDRQKRYLIVLPKYLAVFRKSGAAHIFKQFADNHIQLEDAFACADTHRRELVSARSFGTVHATYINYSLQVCARTHPGWTFLNGSQKSSVHIRNRFDKSCIHTSGDAKITEDFTLPSGDPLALPRYIKGDIAPPRINDINVAGFEKKLAKFKASPKTNQDFYTALQSFAITSIVYRYIHDMGGETVLEAVFLNAPFLARLVDLVICLQTQWGTCIECNDYVVQNHLHCRFWRLSWTYEREALYKSSLQTIATKIAFPIETCGATKDSATPLMFDYDHKTLHVPWHVKHCNPLPVFVQVVPTPFHTLDEEYVLSDRANFGYGIVSGLGVFAEFITFGCAALYEGLNVKRTFAFRYEDREHAIDRVTRARLESVVQRMNAHPSLQAAYTTGNVAHHEHVFVTWTASRDYTETEICNGNGPWVLFECLLAIVYEAFVGDGKTVKA